MVSWIADRFFFFYQLSYQGSLLGVQRKGSACAHMRARTHTHTQALHTLHLKPPVWQMKNILDEETEVESALADPGQVILNLFFSIKC